PLTLFSLLTSSRRSPQARAAIRTLESNEMFYDAESEDEIDSETEDGSEIGEDSSSDSGSNMEISDDDNNFSSNRLSHSSSSRSW
ncbi:unnamed protein product, partial [Rotaria sp. Silwood2]